MAALAAWCLVVAGACSGPEEAFETQLLFVTPVDQDPFAASDQLQITIKIRNQQPLIYEIDAPFPGSWDLTEVPAADAGDVRIEVAGRARNEQDAWVTVANGWAEGFPMPPEEPIRVFFALRGRIGLLDGGLAHPRADGTAILLPDGRVGVFGGWDGSDTSVPDIETLFDDGMGLASDRVEGTIQAADARTGHVAFLVEGSDTDLEGQVVLIGGDEEPFHHTGDPGSAPVMDIVAFDPETNETRVLSQLDDPVLGAVATPAGASVTALIGGFLNEGSFLARSYDYYNKPLLFDAATGTVEEGNDYLTDEREQHTVTLYDEGSGATLLAGGLNDFTMIERTQVWALSTGDEDIADLGQVRMRHTATLLPTGHVLLAGGAEVTDIDTWYDDEGTPLANAELFDPASRSYTALTATLHHARQRHVAVALDDDSGSVLLCGGVETLGGPAVSECEMFTYQGQSFSLIDGGSLSPGGEGMMALPIGDGRILLMGGLDDGDPLDAIYVYNP